MMSRKRKIAAGFIVPAGTRPTSAGNAKATNPKDLIGSTKLPISLVPSTLVALAALAFLEGALKYGRYNWRIAGVRMCIYLDAIHRHTMKLQNGEDIDPMTHVPHLASIIACCGIIHDAKQLGLLNDDRPPALPGFSGTLDQEYVATVAHLKKVFEGFNPKQYTIADHHAQTVTKPHRKAHRVKRRPR